jgi:hypothetical protein
MFVHPIIVPPTAAIAGSRSHTDVRDANSQRVTVEVKADPKPGQPSKVYKKLEGTPLHQQIGSEIARQAPTARLTLLFLQKSKTKMI